MDQETKRLLQELMRQNADLLRRVKALEAKEFAIEHAGTGDPVHAAPEGTFYWDTTGECLWVNSDGNVTWCLIRCCGGE